MREVALGELTPPVKICRSKSTNQSGGRNEHVPDLCFSICRFSQVVFPPSATSRTISFRISNSFWFNEILACQPGVARAFALCAELRRFAPLAGSAQLSRFAITQARDELSYKKLTFSKYSSGRGFWEAGKARIFSSLSSFKGHVHGQLFVLTTYDRYVDGQILKLGQTKPHNHETTKPQKCAKKHFDKKCQKGFIFKVEWWRGWV